MPPEAVSKRLESQRPTRAAEGRRRDGNAGTPPPYYIRESGEVTHKILPSTLTKFRTKRNNMKMRRLHGLHRNTSLLPQPGLRCGHLQKDAVATLEISPTEILHGRRSIPGGVTNFVREKRSGVKFKGFLGCRIELNSTTSDSGNRRICNNKCVWA